jgi:primosomal protein N' (replication factor Y)
MYGEQMYYYEVAVAAPLHTTLTYAQPVEHLDRLPPGLRVLVPLGHRLVTGYVLALSDRPQAVPGKKKVIIKTIVDLLDTSPLFPADMIPLYRWIAEYYHHPLGEVIRTALPGGMTVVSSRVIRLTEKGQKDNTELQADKKYGATPWMKKLLADGELPSGTVGRMWRKVALQRKLKNWEKQGLLVIEQLLAREKIRSKMERVLSLTPELTQKICSPSRLTPEEFFQRLLEQLPDEPGKAEQTLLKHFAALFFAGNGQPVSRRDLGRLYSGTSRIAKQLVRKNVLKSSERRVYRDPFGDRPLFTERPETLTLEQEQVLASILPAIAGETFASFLLFGVTGCGKTEVYLQATEKALSLQKTIIILVPEIALASQIEGHFYSRFGNTLAVLHSGLTAGQRFDEWQRIHDGEVQVVIGARSAIFAPLANIGLIIVDEEHEPSYKQDDGLRYNGRDIAVLRAKFSGCPVILGSATPSLSSFFNARSGKYTLLTMQKRVADQKLPQVEIVDLHSTKKSRPDLFFSDRLIHALEENMELRQQTLLFVNRRGYASFLLCRDCGHVIQCRHCQVSMTLHRESNKLICHYCGYTLPTDILCPGCRTGKVVPLGIGSERIENEVSQILPHARIARLDSDTAGSRKNYLALLKDVRDRKIDILIGTQMIAKGLHFPHVTLVGIVWADSGLNMPDYKAAERTFSLLSQVTGRAGRGELPGRVIIQTNQPGHNAVRLASEHNYIGFYEQEVVTRRELGYPPFSRLVNIRLSGIRENQVQQVATMVAEFLKARSLNKKIEILGPAPTPLAKLRDRYRYQLLLKGYDTMELHHLCHELLAEKTKLCPQAVRLAVDVDPENMM